MKRTVIIVLFHIVLFVFACCAVSDSDDNLLPSWLMEKSWKGKLKDSDIDYIEYSDGDRYVVEMEESEYKIFGVGVYFLDEPCD